jgi:TetR/AcrR family transcriptional regulator, transcriptional repressor of bet genes
MNRAEKKIITLELRRRELVIATLESIRKHGYINSTINTISAESGLSRGLIGHYFKNKDDLLLSAFRYLTETLENFHRYVVQSSAQNTFEKLLFGAMVPFIREQPYREVWLHFWSASRLQPEVAELHRMLWSRYREGTRRRIASLAQERGLKIDVKATALMYTQLIDGLWLGLVLEDAYDELTCRRILRDWLCGVFQEDPRKHPDTPRVDMAALPSRVIL